MSYSENETIVPRNVEDEMKESYLRYSMSVIISRALPDARDGVRQRGRDARDGRDDEARLRRPIQVPGRPRPRGAPRAAAAARRFSVSVARAQSAVLGIK